MIKIIWLDDKRNPFEFEWIEKYVSNFNSDNMNVIWVKNYDDFVNWISENGLPDMVCFDHDLGDDVASKRQARKEKKETKSGYDCAKWLVEYCLDNEKTLPIWVIQSQNPVGKDNINGLLQNFLKWKG